MLEGLKSGNVAETCRKYEIAPNLYYRWKDEVEAGAKAALGGEKRSRTARCRAGEANQTAGASTGSFSFADRDLYKTCWASELRASAFVGTAIISATRASSSGVSLRTVRRTYSLIRRK